MTNGSTVVNGLFIPNILVGAAFGRLTGQLLRDAIPALQIDPGTFALMGSAAMLGGVVRTTISLCVMLMEVTGNIGYALPLTMTLVASKWTGDWFNRGIYDVSIELQHIPLLEWEPPVVTRKFAAQDVMSTPAICLKKVENVARVYSVLRTTTHNGFPIVNDSGILVGLILRSQLLTILHHKAFQHHEASRRTFYHRVKLEDFNADYPVTTTIDSISLTPAELTAFVDLSYYMHAAPYTVFQKALLSRVFRLFRTMGLRHLIVVNHRNRVVGMITRKDLAHCEERVRRSRREARMRAVAQVPRPALSASGGALSASPARTAPDVRHAATRASATPRTIITSASTRGTQHATQARSPMQDDLESSDYEGLDEAQSSDEEQHDAHLDAHHVQGRALNADDDLV